MEEYNLLLEGHWNLNITVEANSKEEAIEIAKEQAEEASFEMNLTTFEKTGSKFTHLKQSSLSN